MDGRDNDVVSDGQIPLSVGRVTINSVELSWPSSSEFNLYSVESGGASAHTGTDNKVVITGLNPNTKYYFAVRGRRANMGWTPVYTTTLVETVSAEFPIWATELSRTSVVFNWSNSGFGVHTQVDDGPIRYFSPGTTRQSVSNLRPGQLVRFKARLEGSELWNEFVVRTLRNKPTPPTFFEAFDKGPSQVSLFWNDGTVDGGALKYKLTRDGEFVERPVRPYTDTSPMQGRDHVYCLYTVDDQFHESDPICITVKFEDFTAPTAPSDLRTSNLGLILSWAASYDSSGPVDYIVDRGVGHELGRTKETEFAVTGLELGERYEFGVTAIDKAGHLSERAIIHYPALGVPVKGKP
jgi:hypothetical protein